MKLNIFRHYLYLVYLVYYLVYLSIRSFGNDVTCVNGFLKLAFGFGSSFDNCNSFLYSSQIFTFGGSIANSLGCISKNLLILITSQLMLLNTSSENFMKNCTQISFIFFKIGVLRFDLFIFWFQVFLDVTLQCFDVSWTSIL